MPSWGIFWGNFRFSANRQRVILECFTTPRRSSLRVYLMSSRALAVRRNRSFYWAFLLGRLSGCKLRRLPAAPENAMPALRAQVGFGDHVRVRLARSFLTTCTQPCSEMSPSHRFGTNFQGSATASHLINIFSSTGEFGSSRAGRPPTRNSESSSARSQPLDRHNHFTVDVGNLFGFP